MSTINEISWNLIYRDTFDRETPWRIEKPGKGIKSGIFCLWQYTLSEGITKSGNRSFSAFNLTFENTEAFRNEAKNHGFSLTDNVINVWNNSTALSKLRTFIYGNVDRINDREIYVKKGGMLLNLLAEYHYNMLILENSSQEISTIKKTSGKILSLVDKLNAQQEFLELLIK